MYDEWLGAREAPPASPSFVLVVRDPASEAQFGRGSWDRAVLARLVGNLARAGAAAIGVDIPLGQPGAPRGGASGDALLSEATATTGIVVYPIALDVSRAATAPRADRPAHPSWREPVTTWLEAGPLAGPLPALAQHAKAIGQTMSVPDADGTLRRLPLYVRLGDRAVPSFGLALAAVFLGVGPEQTALEGRAIVLGPDASRGPALRVPIDSEAHTLVPFAGAGLPRGAEVVPITEIWSAIESQQLDQLQAVVDEKVVLVLAEPTRFEQATPVGHLSDVAIQAHLLNALLSRRTLGEAAPAWPLVQTLVLATVAAWLWLALRWWAAVAGTLVLVGAHAASVWLVLTKAETVLAVWPPLAALALASAGALTWNHFTSVRRFRRLESENARAREALVRHESAVEALEEDLETARAAVARSTGAERDLGRAAEALRAQVAEARAQEEETRRRLAQLERELRGLRPVERARTAAADAHESRECEDAGIVTRDPGVLALFRDLEKAARASLPILLLGEPGTGKELFARAAHRLSPRAGQPFVPVNMAAIPPELFESELFGHVKGSFTGAVADRKGHFAEADRGTLFLDEIGELRPEHQAKLLRVLQEKTFYRVGASRPTTVDVRVVAASNRDLERGAAEGWFREDLYFRLKGMVLRLPPLRERPGDVALLATTLFGDVAAEVGRPGLTLSEEAVAALSSHDWPGNVRELQNVLRQAATLAEGSVVTAADLRLTARAKKAPPVREPAVDSTGDNAVLASLREHRFDMQATGRALGWDRSTVTQRLKGLGFKALVESGGDRAKAALTLAGDPALARTVELKLREYQDHLVRSIAGFDTADAAVAACRRRFKNLPERHFRFLEALVRQRFR